MKRLTNRQTKLKQTRNVLASTRPYATARDRNSHKSKKSKSTTARLSIEVSGMLKKK